MKEIMLAYKYFWGTGLFFFIYALSAVLVVREARGRHIYMTVVLCAVFCFPPFGILLYIGFTIVNRGDPWQSFSSLSGLLLAPYIIPTAVIWLFRRIRHELRIVSVALLGLMLVSLWDFGRSLPDWQRGLDKYYRVNNEAVEICDYIHRENEEYLEQNKDHTIDIRIIRGTEEKGDEAIEKQGIGDWVYVTYIGYELRQIMSQVELHYEEKYNERIDQDEMFEYCICIIDESIMQDLKNKGYKEIVRYDRLCFLEY